MVRHSLPPCPFKLGSTPLTRAINKSRLNARLIKRGLRARSPHNRSAPARQGGSQRVLGISHDRLWMSTFGHNKTLRRPPPDKPEIAKRAALGKRRRKRDQDDTLPPSTRVRGMSEQRSAAADEGASLDHPAADEILQQNIQRRRDSTESQTPSTREPKGFKRIDDDGVNELKKPPVKELTRTSVEGALGFGPKDERYRKIFVSAVARVEDDETSES